MPNQGLKGVIIYRNKKKTNRKKRKVYRKMFNKANDKTFFVESFPQKHGELFTQIIRSAYP